MEPLLHRKKMPFWVDFYKSAYVSLLISTPLCKALLVHSGINVHCLAIFFPQYETNAERPDAGSMTAELPGR